MPIHLAQIHADIRAADERALAVHDICLSTERTIFDKARADAEASARNRSAALKARMSGQHQVIALGTAHSSFSASSCSSGASPGRPHAITTVSSGSRRAQKLPYPASAAQLAATAGSGGGGGGGGSGGEGVSAPWRFLPSIRRPPPTAGAEAAAAEPAAAAPPFALPNLSESVQDARATDGKASGVWAHRVETDARSGERGFSGGESSSSGGGDGGGGDGGGGDGGGGGPLNSPLLQQSLQRLGDMSRGISEMIAQWSGRGANNEAPPPETPPLPLPPPPPPPAASSAQVLASHAWSKRAVAEEAAALDSSILSA